jgi:hypothetical protein
MLAIAAIHTVHSSGINWGQALATWVPIVLSLCAALFGVAKWVRRWQEVRSKRIEALVSGLIQSFASTLNVRFEQIEDHLKQQDTHLGEQDKRFNRIDRKLGDNTT